MMKTTCYPEETTIRIFTKDDEIIEQYRVKKVGVDGSTLYVHRMFGEVVRTVEYNDVIDYKKVEDK